MKLVIVDVFHFFVQACSYSLQKKAHTPQQGVLDVFLPSYRRSSDLSRPTLCTCEQFVTISFCYSIVVKSLSWYSVSFFIEGIRFHIPTCSVMLMFLVISDKGA